jgi:hypothetical protein
MRTGLKSFHLALGLATSAARLFITGKGAKTVQCA